MGSEQNEQRRLRRTNHWCRCVAPTTVTSMETQRPWTFAPCATEEEEEESKRVRHQWGCFHEDRWILCYGLLVQIWHILLFFFFFQMSHFVMVYYNWYFDTIVECNNVWYPPIHVTYIFILMIGPMFHRTLFIQ